uniref:Peptidase S1 domain-containing protein n=1 Tax=Arion vulgaris TaxID=1028688 RepID=A0A0B7A442_9EUPU
MTNIMYSCLTILIIASAAIANPLYDKNLDITVIRQISDIPCIKGQNFGLTNDNAYIWTSNGCYAEFYVEIVEQTTGPSVTTSDLQ